MLKNAVGLFFSPSGGTGKIVKKITKEISTDLNEICLSEINYSNMDLLKEPVTSDVYFTEEDIVIIGMPVFSGRIPEICAEMLKQIHAKGTMAVILVSYGNNSYGDALCELNSIAENQGFQVLSAAAFVSQHSIFNKIAEERPDAYDLEKLIEFGKISACKAKRFATTDIAELKVKLAPLNIKGAVPTKKPLRLPLHPSANSFCIKCGECAKMCPVGAIDSECPEKTDAKKCISCTTCINVCPQGARAFYGPMAAASRVAFEKMCAKRKDPEWFI